MFKEIWNVTLLPALLFALLIIYLLDSDPSIVGPF